MTATADLFASIDRLTADVRAGLGTLAAAVPAAHALAASLNADLDRHAAERRKLGAAPAASPAATAAEVSLDALRSAQEALMLAHVEGLPVLGDRHAVDVLAHHMVDLSRHLTILDLWRDAEEERG